jgi:hypothetical protein
MMAKLVLAWRCVVVLIMIKCAKIIAVVINGVIWLQIIHNLTITAMNIYFKESFVCFMNYPLTVINYFCFIYVKIIIGSSKLFLFKRVPMSYIYFKAMDIHISIRYG